jgi:filamentous hemagglutinin family protein
VLRPVSLAVCLLLGAPALQALPSNPTTTSGQATVQQTTPTQMDIKQSTPRAGLDWTSFSIAAGERVVVSQPGRDAILLNRVIGNDPSQIFGSLQSNGQVWLINPRGIVFGVGSQIDVGGLLASTLSLGNVAAGDDFAAGRISLSRGNEPLGTLRSEGSIRASGGTVVLAAPQISQSGSIEARRIGLAAATQVNVDVEGDGLIFFNARNDGSLDARLAQLGRLTADGGTVEMRAAARAGFADSVLNMDGVVQARSIGLRSGRVVIDGGREGNTLVTGQVDVSGRGAGEHGGEATLLGQQLGLTPTASVDASGATGGGSVRVGGDYQGHNAELPNSRYTVLQQGARILADATGQGDGGRVIVWSDQGTRFQGDISARGGAQGGNGGFAEVSGKQALAFNGRVDLGAAQGRNGTLLLDPRNLTIQDLAPDLDGTATGADLATSLLVFNFPDAVVGSGPAPGQAPTTVDSVITKGAVNTLLGTGNVVLQANNDILIAASAGSPPAANVAITGPNSLTLQAGGNIDIAAPISTNGLTLSANDPGSATRVATGRVSNSAALDAGTGALSISNNGGSGVHQINASVSGSTMNINGSAAFNAAATGVTSITLDGGNAAAYTVGPAGTLAASSLAVNAGTLATTATNQISDATAVSVATGATFTVGGAETINTLALSGTLNGTGALTATTSATLSSGNVATTLNTATLSSSGTSSITAASSASTSTTVTGGALTLGAGGSITTPTLAVNTGTLATTTTNQISDATAVSVATGATFTVGSVETINTLALSGTLNGTAPLTATTSATLTSGNVATTLNTATLSSSGTSSITAATSASASATVTGGALTLGAGGSLATPTLAVNGGALATAAGNQISDATAVSVATGTTFTVGGAETINTLALSGTLNGTAPLTVTTSATLSDGSIATALNTATLSSSGTSSITAASSASTSATVTGGALTLGAGGSLSTPTLAVNGGALATTAANQISDATAVSIATGATFTVGGAETINTLALSGTLNGTAPLTATTSATLISGNVATALNTATLSSSGTSSITAASSASTSATVTGGALTLGAGGSLTAPTVTVDAGTLATTASEQIGDTTAVAVANGAVFSLGGNEIIATLSDRAAQAANGTASVTLGASTLSVASDSATSSFGGVISGGANSGLTKTGNGSLTLTGANTYTGTTTVNRGTLTLGSGASLASPTITLGGGNLVTSGAEQLANTAAVTLSSAASTFTLGGAETINTLALSGTLNGTAPLTATTSVTLNGGSVATALNTATLSSSGTSSITAASSASTSATVTGGTLSVNNGGSITSPLVTVSGGTLALGATGSVSTPTLNVTGGTLSTAAAERIVDTAAVTIGSGGAFNLGGTETVNSLNLSGTLGQVTPGTGNLVVTTATTLNTGTVNADLTTATLSSAGASSLNAAATANTSATVTAGTLSVNNGGSITSPLVTVSGGTLLTTSAAQLNNRPTVQVASVGRLTLGGAEDLGRITASGSVELGGYLSTVQDMSLAGAVTATGGRALTLTSGAGISALNDRNQWGSSLSIVASGPVTLSSGINAGVQRDLTLGSVTLASGGQIDAGVLTLSDNLTLSQGTLTLRGLSTAAAPGTADPALAGKRTSTGRQIVLAQDVVQQAGGRIDVAQGALLSVRAPGDGSVSLQSTGNNFAGGLEVISGTRNSAWVDRPATGAGNQPSLQSQVRISAGQLNVAGAGLEADVLTLRADALTTAAASAGVGGSAGTPAAIITARLPFDSALGADGTLAGLTLITTDTARAAAAGGSQPYGVAGGGEIAINIGSSGWGRAATSAPLRSGVSSGLVAVLPQGGSTGNLAVVFSGPAVDVDGYSFFALGAGVEGNIPVFYNGSGTLTATESISLGSTLSVVESARKERFDDAVRTENVAVRLRQGVIAEVGPGRPATQGSEGLRPPLSCTPASLGMSCSNDARP